MVDESYASERDMKEFQFRQMKRVRAFAPPASLPCERVSLLAASSRYGLLLVGVPSGLRVYETRGLVAANTPDGDMDAVVEDVEHVEVLLPQQPYQLALSCDELTLAVCLGLANCAAIHFYDVRTLAKKGGAAPFSVLRVPAGARILDMKWNPAAPAVAAVCLSDGSALVLDVPDGSGALGPDAEGEPCVTARLPPNAGVTAICWSPKGKQLVCGKINGTMAQYTQTLQEKRAIPCAPYYSEDPVRVLDVCWVSTHVFAVVYAAADGNLDCSPQLVLITLPKRDEKTQEKFMNFSDLCFAPKSERLHRYYLHCVDEWDMIIAASSVSTDVGLLGKQREDPTQWETWTLEDASRAVCPVNDNDDDTLPMGMAVDRSTHMPIPIGDDKSIPAAPVLVLLSTDGLLCPFYMVNKQAGAKDIVAPPQALPTHGERAALADGVLVATLAAPSSATQVPAPVASAVVIPVTPALRPVETPAAAARTWPVAAPGAALTVPPAVRFSFSPSPSLPAPLATPKAVPPAEPLRQAPALLQGSAAAAMVKGGTLGQMLGQPSAAMGSESPSLFSTLAAGGFNMNFAAAQSQSPAPRPISRPLATAVTPRVSAPVASGGQHVPRVAPPTATAPQPPANTGGSVAPVRHAGPSTGAAVKPTAQRASDPYSLGISEEVSRFQAELDGLKRLWAEDDFSVGTGEELARISRDTQGLLAYLGGMKATTAAQHADVSGLQTDVLQSFAELEEARSCLERRRDPTFQQLLRRRSLNPTFHKQLKEIRRLHQYITFTLQDVNDILDSEWNAFVHTQKQEKKLMAPEHDSLFRSLANNRAILAEHAARVGALYQQLHALRARVPPSSHWGGKTPLPSPAKQPLPNWRDDLSALQDALSSTHIRSPPTSPVQHAGAGSSSERLVQLRNFLSKRTIVVTKSTAPANLSASSFLSGRRPADAAGSASSPPRRPSPGDGGDDAGGGDDEVTVERDDDDDEDEDEEEEDEDEEEYDDEDQEDSELDEQIGRVQPSFQAPAPSREPPPLTQHAPLQRTVSVAAPRAPAFSGGGVAAAPSATLKYGAPPCAPSGDGPHATANFATSGKPGSSPAAPPAALAAGVLPPRQAAAAAAISRNAASKPAVTSAPLTESTLKNVPKVVNVMDLPAQNLQAGVRLVTNVAGNAAAANKSAASKPSAAAFSFASHSAFSGGGGHPFSFSPDGAAPVGGGRPATAGVAAPPPAPAQVPGRAPSGDLSFGPLFSFPQTAAGTPGEPGKTLAAAPFSLAPAGNGRSPFGQPAPAPAAAVAAGAGKAAMFSFGLPATVAGAAPAAQGPSVSASPAPPATGDASSQTLAAAGRVSATSAAPRVAAEAAPSFVATPTPPAASETTVAGAAEEPPSVAPASGGDGVSAPGTETPLPPPPPPAAAPKPQQEPQAPDAAAPVAGERPIPTVTAQEFSFSMPPASASTPALGAAAVAAAPGAVAPETPPAAAAAPAAPAAATATAAAAVPVEASFAGASVFGHPATAGAGTFATSTQLAAPQQQQQAAGAPPAAPPAFGFGQPAGKAFGVTPAFGVAAPAAAAGAAPAAVFGAAAAGSLFGGGGGAGAGSTAGGFFGQASAGGGGSGAAFGQAAPAAAAGGTGTGTVAAGGFGFGATSGFGAQAAAPAFGQPAGGGGAFGQPAPGVVASLFGGASGGGFFSDLGSKPSQEAANKNPFGQTAAGGLFGSSSGHPAPNLFGGTAPTFCSPGAGSGGFAEQKLGGGAGGTFSGGASVAAQGFGAISSPPKTPGFGGPPAFGSPPSFGGSPAFGAAPAFGVAPAFGSPVQAGVTAPSAPTKVFGEGTVAASSGSFGFGVVGSAPSFGNLANQASLPSFGSVGAVPGAATFGSTAGGFGAPAQGFGAPAQGFGAPPSTFGGFGGAGGGGGSTGFGGAGFGAPATPSGSAFSGWRS